MYEAETSALLCYGVSHQATGNDVAIWLEQGIELLDAYTIVYVGDLNVRVRIAFWHFALLDSN